MNNVHNGIETITPAAPFELDIATLIILAILVGLVIYFLRNSIKDFFSRFKTWD